MSIVDTKSIEPILIVEDSPEDYETLERGFRRGGLANPIFHVVNGDEALDFLYQRNQFSDPDSSPRPGVIMLDLNMPGTDGREVLAKIKSDPSLASIPVMVLTTSSDPIDIDKCYALGANSYVQKPVDLPGYMEAIQRFGDYWFGIVMLPRKEAA